jgi:aspartate racemase
MKTIGIIGGIAPESTIEYYRLIIAGYREKARDGSYPSIIINSIDMKRMLDLIGAGDRAGVTDYLLDEVARLDRAGAGMALLASNTPHIVFDDLQQRSPIPLISIVESACSAVRALGLKKAGLFGTRFTMQGGFYQRLFGQQGITLSVPDPADQDYIHEKYMGELVNGIFLPETKARFLSIADRMKESNGIQGLILGGTELPLILREREHNSIAFFDTTRIHVERALSDMLS